MKRVKLGKVLNIQNGFAFQSAEYSESGYFVMRIGNVQDGYIDLNNPKYIELEKKELERFVLNSNDILVSLTGNVGRVGIIKDEHLPAVLNQRVARITIRDDSELDFNYLFNFLRSPSFIDVLVGAGHGAAQQNVSTKEIENIEIPLPPLSEQKRIAGILDAADRLRQQDKALIGCYNQLAQSVFLEMFGDPVRNERGWEVKELEEVTTKLGDGLHGTPVYSEDGDHFFVNGNNLHSGKIVIGETTKKVSETEYLKHRKPLDDTTVLVSINGTLGRIAFYSGEKIILGKSACYFNLNLSAIQKPYIFYLLQSDYFQNYALEESTGTTIRNVSLKSMRKFLVPVPPLPLQQKFAEVIENIEHQKAQAEASGKESEGLFQSLLQSAFKGEL